MILINNFYAFMLYVSDSGLQCNKHNSYWYGVQYQDRQTALGSWYGPVEMILPSPPTRAISFPLVRSMTLGQSVYPDIALHISNYHIIMIIGYYTVLCTIWKDIVRVCIVLKTRIERDAAGVESNTDFQ
jgi:hypothetical protein